MKVESDRSKIISRLGPKSEEEDVVDQRSRFVDFCSGILAFYNNSVVNIINSYNFFHLIFIYFVVILVTTLRQRFICLEMQLLFTQIWNKLCSLREIVLIIDTHLVFTA